MAPIFDIPASVPTSAFDRLEQSFVKVFDTDGDGQILFRDEYLAGEERLIAGSLESNDLSLTTGLSILRQYFFGSGQDDLTVRSIDSSAQEITIKLVSLENLEVTQCRISATAEERKASNRSYHAVLEDEEETFEERIQEDYGLMINNLRAFVERNTFTENVDGVNELGALLLGLYQSRLGFEGGLVSSTEANHGIPPQDLG